MTRFFAYALLAGMLLCMLAGCSPSPAAEPSASLPPPTETAPSPSPSPAPSATGGEMPIPSDAPSPSATPGNEALATFSTPVLDANEKRSGNLMLACEELDGLVVKAGESFSFNETVGRRTREKGYKEAHAFVDGEEVNMVGGGVCQVASTLYQAVLGAELEILERHEHSREVYYLPLGQDATVSYGSLDFRFRNTLAHDICVAAEVAGGEVLVSILKVQA